MVSIYGYFNGVACIPLETGNLRVNQKVIITALDEVVSPKVRKLGTLEGKATISFAENWDMSDEELLDA